MMMNNDHAHHSAQEHGDYSTMVHGEDGMKMDSNNSNNHASMDNMDSMQMSMTFYTGKGFYVLFDSFHVVSDTDLILVCLVASHIDLA